MVDNASSHWHDAAEGMVVIPVLFVVVVALVVHGARRGGYRHSTRKSPNESRFSSNYILIM